MDPNTFPTKGNLIQAKNSLELASEGYELMDKKRNILIRELMNLIEEAKGIQAEIDSTFTEAYRELQRANIQMGISRVQAVASNIDEDDTISIKTRSIMGTEIPLVEHPQSAHHRPPYSFLNTSPWLDRAYLSFEKVKTLTIRLSMVENSAYRLASSISKTQKRANALKNITIPYYTELTKTITEALEEKEREEFTRLKVIKRQQTS